MLKRRVYNFFKSSFYFDFFIKKIAESVVRNLSIYTSLFFCEKFVIEYLTQVSIDRIFLLMSRLAQQRDFFFETFFHQIVVGSFYFFALAELIYIFC